MDAYIKCAVEGVAEGQTIVSILYAGNESGEPLTGGAEPDVLEAYAAAWAEQNADLWVAMLPDTFTLTQLRMSGVDDRLVVVSDNEVVFPVGVPGARDDASDGVDLVAIIRLPNIRVDGLGTRNVKRSYVAYGPIGSEFINNDKSFTLGSVTFLDAVLPIFSEPVVVGLQEAWPVRIARTVDPAQPGVGKVQSPFYDPIASSRKSRRPNPRGT